MIHIQKLKQPKESSGKKLEAGKVLAMQGVVIKNKNSFPIYINAYQRKRKAEKRAK